MKAAPVAHVDLSPRGAGRGGPPRPGRRRRRRALSLVRDMQHARALAAETAEHLVRLLPDEHTVAGREGAHAVVATLWRTLPNGLAVSTQTIFGDVPCVWVYVRGPAFAGTASAMLGDSPVASTAARHATAVRVARETLCVLSGREDARDIELALEDALTDHCD